MSQTQMSSEDVNKMEDSPRRQTSRDILVDAAAFSESYGKLRPVLTALAVCLGSFAFGTVIGYPSTAMPNLNDHPNPFHINEEQNSWVGSIITLGALVGGLVGGIYMDRFGRKMGLLYAAIPFALSWMVIASATNFAWLLVGRALTGFCTGVFSVICPVYIAEISPSAIRGLLGSCHQLAICLGILFTYGFGAFLTWSWLAIACEVVIVIMAAVLVFIPESPRWLLVVGRKDDAKFALYWLRGEDYDVVREIAELTDTIEKSRDRASFREFLQPQLLKPLLISVGLMVFQQFSGINVVMFYTVEIFRMAKIDLDPNMQTIVVGIVGVVGTLVSVFVADLVGRRVLLLASAVIMALSIGSLGAFFYELDVNSEYAQSSLTWLPVTCLVLFNFGFDVAFGPIAWLMMGELFPLRAKGVATSIVTVCNWTFAFIITKFFVNITTAITIEGGYWFFTCFCVLAIPFIVFFVPETKGKTLEEIEISFRQ